MQRRLLALALTGSISLVTACASSGHAIGNSVDDASITAQVKTALLNDSQVNATKIDVSTSNGVVTMSGTVRSQPEQERAIQIARRVNGVKDVKANLNIGT